MRRRADWSGAPARSLCAVLGGHGWCWVRREWLTWRSRWLGTGVGVCALVGAASFLYGLATREVPGPPIQWPQRIACGLPDGASGPRSPVLVVSALDDPCIGKAFRSCPLTVAYSVELDSSGIVRGVKMPEWLSAEQRACILRVASREVWLPARSCTGAAVPSSAEAGFETDCRQGEVRCRPTGG